MTQLQLFLRNEKTFPVYSVRKIGSTFLFAVFISFSSFAQQVEIKGKVLEENTKAPVIGATIRLKKIHGGAISGYDGTFSIKAKNLPVTLIITSTGYKNLTDSNGVIMITTKKG